jgi:hypothetical protein
MSLTSLLRSTLNRSNRAGISQDIEKSKADTLCQTMSRKNGFKQAQGFSGPFNTPNIGQPLISGQTSVPSHFTYSRHCLVRPYSIFTHCSTRGVHQDSDRAGLFSHEGGLR